jgi:TonB family protein
MANSYKKAKTLEQRSTKVFIAAIVISLVLHALSYVELSYFLPKKRSDLLSPTSLPDNKRTIVTLKEKKSAKPDELQSTKILETRQTPTEKPQEARHKGAQDHKAEKEMRLKESLNQAKALDPGYAGQNIQNDTAATLTPRQQLQKQKEIERANDLKTRLYKDGTLSTGKFSKRKRNSYERLLPEASELASAMKAGYQEHLDEKIAVGNRIDINTTDYRFIGYFTNLRKAFELVWVYPLEAKRRGWQGVVAAEFTIKKDGSLKSVKVLESSGHPVLDEAVVQALRLASPFAPLPEGIGKDHLQVTGNFRYVLSGG